MDGDAIEATDGSSGQPEMKRVIAMKKKAGDDEVEDTYVTRRTDDIKTNEPMHHQ